MQNENLKHWINTTQAENTLSKIETILTFSKKHKPLGWSMNNENFNFPDSKEDFKRQLVLSNDTQASKAVIMNFKKEIQLMLEVSSLDDNIKHKLLNNLNAHTNDMVYKLDLIFAFMMLAFAYDIYAKTNSSNKANQLATLFLVFGISAILHQFLDLSACTNFISADNGTFYKIATFEDWIKNLEETISNITSEAATTIFEDANDPAGTNRHKTLTYSAS